MKLPVHVIRWLITSLRYWRPFILHISPHLHQRNHSGPCVFSYSRYTAVIYSFSPFDLFLAVYHI